MFVLKRRKQNFGSTSGWINNLFQRALIDCFPFEKKLLMLSDLICPNPLENAGFLESHLETWATFLPAKMVSNPKIFRQDRAIPGDIGR